MKFGDGSIIEIEGRDTILFVSKGGKHRKLTHVYFISRLEANLVSLGQLNEAAVASSLLSAAYSRSTMIDDGSSRKFGAQQTAFTS